MIVSKASRSTPAMSKSPIRAARTSTPRVTLACSHHLVGAEQGKRDRPKELCPLDEDRGADVDGLGRGLDRVATDRLAERVHQHITPAAEQAADDHALRVDQVAQPGHGDADLAPGVGDGAAAAYVTVGGELDHPRKREPLAVHRSHELDDGGPGRDRLEASAVAAVAEGARLVESRVPDL